MPDLTIEIHLSAAQMLGYYRGQARTVQARAATGQTIQFPASALQRHIAPDGIHGRFRIEFDAQNKFLRLERLP